MPIDKLIPRKLNSDIDSKLIDRASMVDALNLYAGDDSDGGGGVLKNVKGNTKITQPDSFGENSRVLGSVVDDKTGISYFFVYSTEADKQGIWAYDPEGKLAGDDQPAVRLIYRDAQFNFDPQGFVKGDVVHVNHVTFPDKGDEFDKDAIIFFTDNRNEPRKINAYRAYKAGGYSLYSNVYDTADFITACPKTPLIPITFSFDRDVNRKISNFKGTSGFQFAYQHVYIDGFESSVSSYSDVAFPPSVINQGALTNASHDNYNRCILYIPQPGAEIKSVKILAREGSTGSFLLVDEISTLSLYTSGNYIGTYSFYNDRITKGFSKVEVNKQFDSIPKRAKAQAIADNRLIYGNYLDGFDPVNVSCTAQVVYRERPQDFVDFNIKTNSFIGVHIDDENTSEAESAKRKSAGFTIDTSSLPDSVIAGTSILLKVAMTPDGNWHIYNSDNSYHQSRQIGEYEKFPISSEWNEFGNSSINYELQNETDSGLDYLRGITTSADGSAMLLAGDNNGIVGDGVSLNWKTRYHPITSNQNYSFSARIGTSSANPIILKGGTILFQAGFTTSVSIPSGFSVIAAKTIEELFLGVSYADLTYKAKISESALIQSSEAVLNHSLPVGNQTQIPQAYIGQQGTNTDLSKMIMAVLQTSQNKKCPLGYVVFKQATAKFKLRPVKNTNNVVSPTKKAFRLAVSSLTNVKPITCYKSMFAGAGNIGSISNFPFLNRWGTLDPDLEFFNADGTVKLFDPDAHFSYYGDDIFIDDLNLDESNAVNNSAGAGTQYQYMIGHLVGSGQNTFDLIPEDGGGIEIACIFDGEGGPGGGPSRGGGNKYDDLRMNHQGSIPMCTPLVYDLTLSDPVASMSLFATAAEGDWSTAICRTHSPMWTGRISLSPYSSNSIFSFGDNQKSASILPLIQNSTTSLSNVEVNENLLNLITYPIPEEGDPGILDAYSVNFNYLHSNVDPTGFVTGTYSGDVFRSFKSNSNHDFGIVYYDERGRHGFVNYLANVFVPGLSSSERPEGSEGGPASVAITLNHEPPSWAHYYKIVYGGNSTIDSFIQYTVPNAYIRKYDENQIPETANIYVSLNYLQGNPISYTGSFGAKSIEGGINMYKFKEGDKLRIISSGPDGDRTYYPSGAYEFDVIDLIDVAPPAGGDASSIKLVDPDNQSVEDSPRLQGQFLVLRDNQDASGFRYQEVSANSNNKWKENCVVEIYSPSKDLGKDEKFYYELSNTYRVAKTSDGTLTHSPSTVILNKGDVWFRKAALNWKDSNFTDLIPVETNGDAESNFKSFFVESFTATDLHRSDFKGFGRQNLINDEAKEVRRESSVTYSDKSNPESAKSRYTSFDINKLNYNDYDYSKGEITFLSPTSGYLIVLQNSRTSLIPLSKNILSDAAGSTNLVSSNVVLGEAIEQAGVGGSDSPESVIESDDRIYYANKKDGKIYLYTKGGGAKDISTNFIGSAIRKSISSQSSGVVKLVGGYDGLKEEYLITIVPFSELTASGVVIVSQPLVGADVSITGITGIAGGPGEQENGLGVSGFQVFVDTDGDGIIGINEFLNQTQFNLEDFPFIPTGEVAVPPSLAGIAELAGQITIDSSSLNELISAVFSVIDGVDIGGASGAQTEFILGGILNYYAAENSLNLNSASGLSELLTNLDFNPSLLAADDAGGGSNFSNTFDINSNYDLIFKLASNGVGGFAVPPKSEGVDTIVTNGELLEVASVLGLTTSEGINTTLNADLNLDGIIGTGDLLILLSYFGSYITDDDYPDPDAEAFNIENFTS